LLRPIKVNSLTLGAIVALLGVLLVVSILPDVDLPDTAFQRNASLQALLVLSHLIPHASTNAGSVHLSLQFKDASVLPRQVQEACGRCSSDLPIRHQTLRC
jgi:hypothetical protein